MRIILLLTMLMWNIQILAVENSIFENHFNNYAENLEDAIDEKKAGIFIFFHMDECPFCQKMKDSVLNNKQVIKYFQKHFLSYMVDVESSVELVDFNGKKIIEKDFAKIHNLVGATPVLAFFDLTGKRVVRRTGFASKKEFLLLAKYMVEKAYINENFVRYKRKNR